MEIFHSMKRENNFIYFFCPGTCDSLGIDKIIRDWEFCRKYSLLIT